MKDSLNWREAVCSEGYCLFTEAGKLDFPKHHTYDVCVCVCVYESLGTNVFYNENINTYPIFYILVPI